MRFHQVRRERHVEGFDNDATWLDHVIPSVVVKGFRIGILHGFGTGMIPVCFRRDVEGRVGEYCAGITRASRPWTLLDHGFVLLRILVSHSRSVIG